MSHRFGSPGDSRARFCLLVSLVWLALALAGARLDAQLSSSFGGDLAGRPSAARVEKIRGFPTLPTTPTAGDVWKWNGSAWGPDVDLVGEAEGSSVATLSRLWTLPVTASYNLVTSDVTVCTITLDPTKAVTGCLVVGMFGGTSTTTATHSMRISLYANGYLIQGPFALQLGNNVTRRYLNRWSYGLLTLPGYPECVETSVVDVSNGGQIVGVFDQASTGLSFPWPYGIGGRSIHATDPITLEVCLRSGGAYVPAVSVDYGMAWWLP